MGARLYRYYSNEFMGYTSWKVIPIWGMGGIMFYFIYQILQVQTGSSSLLELISSFFISGMIAVIIEFLLAKIFQHRRQYKGFHLFKYLYFISFIWGGVIGIIFKTNTSIIWFFLISSILGMVLEIIMGITFPKIFGRRLWIYERYSIAKGASSWLMVPIWGISSVVIFFALHLVF